MGKDFSKLVYPELSYEINGILYTSHNTLGRYRNEKEHGDLIEKMLQESKIKYEREKILPNTTNNTIRNKVDFMIKDLIVLELKCKRVIGREDFYQLKRYLEVSNKKLGILVNFRQKHLKPQRVLNSSFKD